MPPISLPDCPEGSVELKSYSEKVDYAAEAEGKPESKARSQTLVYRWNDSQWWIKVTFQDNDGIPKEPMIDLRTSKRRRLHEFQTFVRLIDYASLPLLDDTVTEVILDELSGGQLEDSKLIIHGSEEVASNHFVRKTAKLQRSVREDPSRVVYPSRDEFPAFQAINLDELSDREEITDGVFQVLHVTTKTPYVLKVVDRPLYQPHDTEAIRQELRNLEILQNVPNIAQAAGIAVSTNPYMTSSKKRPQQPLVVSGIVIEYHSGGSLRTILRENRLLDFPTWKQWPLQIATALHSFHNTGLTHLDIKPGNIVLDTDSNAILIDISGIGGITHGWCAPEIRDEIMPSSLPFKLRRSNDTWAYGKLLLSIAPGLHAPESDSDFVRGLKQIAGFLMREDIRERVTIPEAIQWLERVGGEQAHIECK